MKFLYSFLLLSALSMLALAGCGRDSGQAVPPSVGPRAEAVTVKSAQALMQERQALDESVWKTETLAQEYERFFVNLWDNLRAASDAYTVLAAVPFEEILIPAQSKVKKLDWGVVVLEHKGDKTSVDHAEAQQII